MIRVACEKCGKRYFLKDVSTVHPGHRYRLKCKICGHAFVVSGSEVARLADEPGGSAQISTEHPLSTEPQALTEPQVVTGPPAGDTTTPTPAPASEPPPDRAGTEPSARFVDLFADADLLDSPPPPTPPTPPTPTPTPAPERALATPAPARVEPAPSPTPAPRRPDRSLHLAAILIFGASIVGIGTIAYVVASSRSAPQHPAPELPAPPPPSAAVSPPPPPAPPPAAEAPPPPAPEADANVEAPIPPPSGGSTETEQAAPSVVPPPAPPPPPPAPAPQPERKVAAPSKPPARPDRTERSKPRPAPPKREVARAEPQAATPPSAAPASPESADSQLPETLRPDQIQRVVASGQGAFDACLKSPSRGAGESLGGRRVTLRILVAPDGSVSYSTIDDVAVASAPVGECLKAAARKLSFPQFGSDRLKVDVPIQLPDR